MRANHWSTEGVSYRIFLSKNCALVICPSACLMNHVIDPPCNSYRRSNRAVLLPVTIAWDYSPCNSLLTRSRDSHFDQPSQLHIFVDGAHHAQILCQFIHFDLHGAVGDLQLLVFFGSEWKCTLSTATTILIFGRVRVTAEKEAFFLFRNDLFCTYTRLLLARLK